jgi:hypothetical protein
MKTEEICYNWTLVRYIRLHGVTFQKPVISSLWYNIFPWNALKQIVITNQPHGVTSQKTQFFKSVSVCPYDCHLKHFWNISVTLCIGAGTCFKYVIMQHAGKSRKCVVLYINTSHKCTTDQCYNNNLARWHNPQQSLRNRVQSTRQNINKNSLKFAIILSKSVTTYM